MEETAQCFAEADRLVAEDQAFKEQCRAEYATLEEEMSELEARSGQAAAVDDAETRREVERQTAAVDDLRSQVANASRQVAQLELRLDEVPSRAEISQYQKRFVELYNQVSSTHKEAKEYIATNNLLSDTQRYLQNELSLLNSVAESYRAAAGPAQRAEFLEQLDSIVANITANRRKVETKKEAELRAVDVLKEQLDGLRALARTYHATLKQFRDECAANETLTAQRDGS